MDGTGGQPTDSATAEQVSPPGDFWLHNCCPWTKQMLFFFLVTCFFGQTMLVYSDPSGDPPLSDEALEGRRIWHEKNCQSCHQLYGFGGFLGPDLTNVASRVSQERLQFILTQGTAPMPAYGFSSEEIELLGAFFTAMDATGKGQAKQRGSLAGNTVPLFTAIVREEIKGGSAEAQLGFTNFLSRGCMRCHIPFSESTVGPDLSTVRNRLSEKEIHQVMRDGRNVMPPTGFEAEEQDQVYRFFGWLNENREPIRERVLGELTEIRFQPFDLPWWEY